MDASIGAFEAKAQLSRLLRAVEQGERFTITVRGKPVADLVPHRAEATQAVAAAAQQEDAVLVHKNPEFTPLSRISQEWIG